MTSPVALSIFLALAMSGCIEQGIDWDERFLMAIRGIAAFEDSWDRDEVERALEASGWTPLDGGSGIRTEARGDIEAYAEPRTSNWTLAFEISGDGALNSGSKEHVESAARELWAQREAELLGHLRTFEDAIGHAHESWRWEPLLAMR